MSSIDDRIVNMQFNNAQFQQGISQTNASLDELKNNLKLNGATDGIDGVQQAASRFSLANMEQAVENISSKFSVFGAVGFTILQNLTNSAINAGKQIGDALISPILDGGEKRALALQQAQFQFRGLGLDIDATMATAKAAVLGTAFSLDQAATAAAVFGTSGVVAGHGLEEALRGIAGVAAQSGAAFGDVAQIFEKINGNQRVMSEDLLSLSARGINAAAILAKSMGTTEVKVRDLVSHGKISFAQFSKAMNDAFGANAAKANELFTGALSNMQAALARLGADFEGPKLFALRDIFNAMSPFIDKVHAALLPLINDFNLLQTFGSGQAVNAISNLLGPGVIASIQNVVRAIETIGKAIGKGFHKIFPDDTAAQLTAVSIFLQNITAAFIPGTKAAGELQRTFAGLFAIFDILGRIIGSIINAFANLFGFTTAGSGSILGFTAHIGDLIVKFDAFIKKANGFQGFFQGLAGILAIPIGILKTFFGIIADGVKDLAHFDTGGLDDFANDVQKRFSGLVQIGSFFTGFWNGVKDVVGAIWGFLKPIFQAIGDFFAPFAAKIKSALQSLTFDQGIKALNTGILGGFLFSLNGFFGNLGNLLKGNGLAIIGPFKTIMASLRTNLKALEINTNAKTLKEIAISVALLAASAVALSLVDSSKLVLALGAMKLFLVELFSAFEAFTKIQGTKGILQSLALVIALQGIATAILILTGAIAILGALPLDNLIQGVIALVVVLGAFVGAMKLMSNIGPGVIAAGLAIALIAPAIAILAGAIALFGVLPLANLIQGTAAFVVVLAALVGALALMNKLLNPASVLASALSIAIIADAMALLVGAVAAFGALPFQNVLQGVIAFVVVLAALVGALALLNLLGPEVLLGAIAIGLVGLSMVPLIGAVALLGALPIANIVQGVGALIIVLAAIAGIVLLLGFTGPASLIGAAAIVAISLAMVPLASSLKLLSTISWDGIGRLLTVLAAGLGILVVMGILLIPASVGFLLFGIAVLAIGAGVSAAATGIGLLAIGIAALVAVGAGGIALFGLALQAFIDKLPALGVAIGAAFVSFVVTIGAQADKLIAAFVKLLLAMLSAIDQVVPQIIIVATDIVVALINALTTLIPLLINLGLTIIVALITGIANNIGKVVTQALNIVINFINALASKLGDVIAAGGNLVLAYINGIASYVRNNSSKFVTAGTSLFNAIVDGVAKAISSGGTTLRNAGAKIGNALIQGARNALGINSPSKVFRDYIIPSIFEGIEAGNTVHISRAEDAGNAIGDTLGSSALNSVKNAVSGISDALNVNMDMTPTIRPVLDLSDIQNKSKQIAGLMPTPTISMDTSNDVATSVALQEQDKNAVLSREPETDTKTGNTVIFTQNNNSPKALSTAEVYRQTNNQLSTLRGDLGVVDQSGSPQ